MSNEEAVVESTTIESKDRVASAMNWLISEDAEPSELDRVCTVDEAFQELTSSVEGGRDVE